jgi:quercetin 2,3-dioxygenase
MAEAVLQTVPLGGQWPTIDPFLFCVHHHDRFPVGDGAGAPAVALEGRPLGQDFGDIDGWNMYHGQRVPGFPGHPHRGFETVTYVRRGLVDHADSLGAIARYGEGDVQWLTAGGGIVHSEMFPLLDDEGPNPLELFQIWVNLPAADKMAEPHFTMLWAGDVPRLRTDGAEVTVIAGSLGGLVPPPPPPRSWAARPESDLAIWHVRLEPGGSFELPAAGPETVRTLYVFDGAGLQVDGEPVGASTGAVVACDRATTLTSAAGSDALVLQGRPIGEPVARYGPFVMNDDAGVEQALEDYRRTEFGGWPWPDDDPVHGLDPARFARRPDGTVERPSPAPAAVD